MSPHPSQRAASASEDFPSGRQFIHRYRYFVLAGLLVPIILYLAAMVIQSPAERVEATVKLMAQIVEREDADGLAEHIAPEYWGEIEADRDMLLASARDYFRDVSDTRIRIVDMFVRLNGDEAEVMLVYRFRAKMNTNDYRNVPIVNLFENEPNVPKKTYLQLVQQGDAWRLVFIALQGRPFADRFPEAARYFE